MPTQDFRATRGIDPRGPRFGAAITSLVLVCALLVPPAIGIWLVGFQAVVFAAGALLGTRYQLYGLAFRRLIQPRLAKPADLEDPALPRFAQAVGFGFLAVALVGGVLALDWLFYAAAAFALVAALLNAVFAVCLGCELYLAGARLRRRQSRPTEA